MRSIHLKCLIGIVASFALAAGSARAEIKIGIAGPLSGSALAVGEQQEIGANSAIDYLNTNGGLLGQEIVITSVDDACNPEQAKAAARQLVAEGVIFVVGHVCSGASIAAGGIYEEAGIIMISSASTNPVVTDAGHQNVFRVIGRDDQQGIIAGNFMADRYADKNIAIIHDGQEYGLGLAQFTKHQLNERGVTEVMFDSFMPDQSDYRAIVDKLIAGNIDVIYGGGYQGDLAIILRQAKKELPNLQLIGGDSLTNNEFLVIAGAASEGTYLTFGPDVRLKPEAASVVASIRDTDAYEPEGYTLYSYAAVQAWAQAVQQAGSLDQGAVIKALKTGSFETVLGKIGFDDKGDVTGVSAFVWYIWTAEDYVLVE
jgi:branched-chain amino acid transport system substrate-binding protein